MSDKMFRPRLQGDAPGYPTTELYDPVPFRDRARPMQIMLGAVVPAWVGALDGVLIGVSTAAFWGVALLACAGVYFAGSEHRDGWDGADRGLVSGLIFGVALLLVHGFVGTTAHVSLGPFPPLFAVLTAIIGMLLGAAGGRIARLDREQADEHRTTRGGA
jgi:hypothetical protein